MPRVHIANEAPSWGFAPRAFAPALAADVELPSRRRAALCGVTLPPVLDETAEQEALARLTEAEWAQVTAASPHRAVELAGGRVAIRGAERRLGLAASSVVSTLGGPRFSAGRDGSLSHTRGLAVALLVEQHDSSRGLGVDVERIDRPKRRLAHKILTRGELTELDRLAPHEQEARLTLAFAAKEAAYKAIHRFVQRYVSFHEVELSWEGSAIGSMRAELTCGTSLDLRAAAWSASLGSAEVGLSVVEATRR